MRNKVKNNVARSIIAMLLTLVMIAGSFSISVFADTEEAVSGDTKAASAAEKTEKADQTEKAEKSESEEKAKQSEPEEKTEKTEPEEKTEKADSVEKTDSSEPEEKEEKSEPAADAEKGEPAEGSAEEGSPSETPQPAPEESAPDDLQPAEAVAVMPMAAAVRDAKNAEAGFAVNFNSDDVTVFIDDDGTVVKPGDKVEAGKTLYLSPKPDACDYELSVSKADGSAVEVSEDEDTFTMPESDVTVSVTLYYNFTLDLSAEDVPDGFYVVVGGTKVSKGEKGTIKAEAGKAVPVSEIADLGKDYNYAQERPSGKHQLKMLISSGGSSKKITLDSFRNSGYTMPEANAKASLYVLHRWITKLSGDARSCSLTNDSDSDAPWYGHAGDRITIHMFSDNFKSLEVTVKDDQDNVIYSSSQIMENYTFTMPASVVYINITGVANKAQYNVTVRTPKYGTVKVGSKQFERDLVELEVVPDEGYAVSLTGVLIMYKQGDKTNAIKADIVKKGSNKFTFRMPSADVTVATAFSVPRYVNVVTNKGGKVTVDYNNPYGDYTTKNKSVRLKVTPKKGYKLKAWTAKTTDGKNIDIDKNGEFSMPDTDVTVAAVFGKIKSGGSSSGGTGTGTGSYTGGDTYTYDEPYYTGEVIEDDGEEVDEEITPEELINLVPLTSAITAQTVLMVTTSLSLMMAS